MQIPDHIDNMTQKTDAIVVLTGGADRLQSSVDLLLNGRAKKLFITGVGGKVKELGDLNLQLPKNYDPNCCIELGYRAEDTFGNAAEAAHWMQHHRYKSLRLVTAAYHMPRSLLEFRNAMPDAEIVPHPIFLNHVRTQEWWRWPGTTLLVLGEYHKYLFARLGHWFLTAYFQTTENPPVE